MIYTNTDNSVLRAHALVARAHSIGMAPERGYLPALVVDQHQALAGLNGVCRVEDILKERINIRAIGMSFSIGDILRLAADYFGYSYTTPAQICVNTTQALEDAIVGAVRKLVTQATNALGLDCGKKQWNNWRDILSSLARNIEISGSDNGLSISVDWAGLGMEFLQYVVCAAINAASAFVGRIASDVIAVVDRIKQRCQACLGSSSTKISSSSQALNTSSGSSSSSGGGSYGGGGYGVLSGPNLLPLLIAGSITAAGAYWIWKKRRRR